VDGGCDKRSALTQVALQLVGGGCGVVLGDHQPVERGPLELDDDGGPLSVHSGEILDFRTPSRPDGDDAREAGSGSPDTPELGPWILDEAHRVHCGERDANVAVDPLDLLESGEIQHELVTFDGEPRHDLEITACVVCILCVARIEHVT
jgi:hypothetical protein